MNPDQTDTPRTDLAKRLYDQWSSDCDHPNRQIRTIAQTFEQDDGWQTAAKLERDLSQAVKVAGEALEMAIEWSESDRMMGPMLSKCEAALSELQRITGGEG